ncbi:DNA-binding LacI/PurR family transcriptional regulator [Thermocatellispora tengchongensis]|uniref:DNA-binding LacI/PurR family transcriptional regulator n=1 Tax=Thermocatellispora tengchongensis TaxID=1073253 RepID=A0A840P8E3_9ACTN|nr:GntR family transcriptional regulator [Thermocatellispora tengchongensis]MBB5133477.1 DNA-binding LacI/PurR family transcriptional regulator [Thermocatellispora tengchongensis]
MNSLPRGRRFRTLAARLRQEIVQGRWPVGGRLPTETELAQTYSVGVNTVRRAVDLLVEEGLVRRRQGSGTFVTASGASGPRPRFIGALVPSNTYYYPQVIQGIERAATAAGVRLVLACSDYDPDVESAQMRQLVDAGVSGLLLVPNLHLSADPAAHLAGLRRLPVPYVLVERRPEAPGPADPTSYVCTDALGGGYTAVQHLARLGRGRIGYLGRIGTATSEQVFAGYRQAVADLGLPEIPAAVARQSVWTGPDLLAYANVCATEKVRAVVCLGDREGTALLPYLRRVGLTVPGDVALVAYDDEVADLAEVPLTAVSPPKAEVGRMATELLLRRIELGSAAPVCRVVLQPRLAVRASCGAASGTLVEVRVPL